MDARALAGAIARDRAGGMRPFFAVATMGTTGAGHIDPAGAICGVAHEAGVWVHADAAWGGAAAVVPELRPHLGAIERCDSITFDAHKWLSVPMGAGMFLTRHPEIPPRTFSVDTQYMPVSGSASVVEPHQQTMQWSRRFIGLKVFLSLAVAGWEGYAEAIRAQTARGDELRAALEAAGWRVVNDTPLPTICFVDATRGDNTAEYLARIAAVIVGEGRAWISTTRVGGVVPVLRATITNYRTESDDVAALVRDLDAARRRTRGDA
jgi:glutamate/tyrosine decarboxylase-like PLP-dependent enzyme